MFSGHKLLHKQSDVPIKGWAVECRVYAEVSNFEIFSRYLPTLLVRYDIILLKLLAKSIVIYAQVNEV